MYITDNKKIRELLDLDNWEGELKKPTIKRKELKMVIKNINEIKTADEARELAIDWQEWQSNEALDYQEVAKWGGYFEALAEKFPELKDEFIENAII